MQSNFHSRFKWAMQLPYSIDKKIYFNTYYKITNSITCVTLLLLLFEKRIRYCMTI